MEADVSGGWTKSPVMTCSSLSVFLCLSVCLQEETPLLRVAIHSRTVVYPTAIWREEREERLFA